MGREVCRLLLLAKRTGVRKEHVVTMLALQLPNCGVTCIRYSTTILLHDPGCRWLQNNISEFVPNLQRNSDKPPGNFLVLQRTERFVGCIPWDNHPTVPLHTRYRMGVTIFQFRLTIQSPTVAKFFPEY
jgi:hypothetical protein